MRYVPLVLLLFIATCCFSQSQNEELAYQYFAEKQYEKAVILYKDLHKKAPKKEYYESLMTAYLFLERYKEAEKLAKVQLKKNPNRIEYGIDHGYVLEKWGKQGKADQVYENTIKSMVANTNSILSVGNRFYQKKKYEYAIKAYKKGNKLLHGDYPFAFELAKVHEAKGDISAVSGALIGVLNYSDEYLESVQIALSTYFHDDSNGKKRRVFKDILLTKIQKKPNNTYLSELLIWLFIQEKKFASALTHSKALDKRNKEAGSRIVELANICVQNKEYEIGLKAYKYLAKKEKGSYYYRVAKSKMVEILNLKIEQDPTSNYEDILSLKKNYEEALEELGRNNFTMDLIRGYAKLLAFKFNEIEKAKLELQHTLKMGRARTSEIAKCKLTLGDIYVKENEIWEAALLYGQVNQDFKDDVIGHKAKFKSAKAYFYTGDFEWAKTQLDVLKASTTKLIANDAMQLSVLISDNLGLDTTTAALRLYAKADLYNFQNNDSLAFKYCDSILLKFPKNRTLLDDVYFMQAKIRIKARRWEEAIELFQQAVDYDDLLKDDALFQMGVIYEQILRDSEKAMKCYEKIILEHQDSFYVFEARKKFRTLRGDFSSQ
jgi:tetratricopeptide (TPR) repeat protein